MSDDYYGVLGVPRDADADEIKRAFRRWLASRTPTPTRVTPRRKRVPPGRRGLRGLVRSGAPPSIRPRRHHRAGRHPQRVRWIRGPAARGVRRRRAVRASPPVKVPSEAATSWWWPPSTSPQPCSAPRPMSSSAPTARVTSAVAAGAAGHLSRDLSHLSRGRHGQGGATQCPRLDDVGDHLLHLPWRRADHPRSVRALLGKRCGRDGALGHRRGATWGDRRHTPPPHRAWRRRAAWRGPPATCTSSWW